MPAGWPPSIGARRWRRLRRTWAFRCMSGSSETRPRMPGRQPDRLGVGPARHAPHAVRRQCRAAFHAARQVDLVLVGADRVAAQRRRLQQDRHLPEGPRRRATITCPSMWPASPTIDWTLSDGVKEIPIESAIRRKSPRRRAATHDGRPCLGASLRTAPRRSTTAST